MSGDSPEGETSSIEPFEELYNTCFAEIWRFVRRRSETTADADDVAAEVFAIAWRRRVELPPDDERRLWLYGIARNVVRNHKRSAFRQRRLTTRLQHLRVVTKGETSGPVERDDGLWLALSRLSEPDRELLLMRAWDGLAVGEIAKILDCTTNAASIRLSKARARLRTELTKKDRPPGGHVVVDLGPEGGHQ